MRSIAILVALMLVGASFATSAEAQTFSLAPANPTSIDFVQVRIDFQGCDATAGTASVDAANHRVLVQVTSPDTCDAGNPANTTSPRYIPVGQLAAGQYTVDYQTCPFAPGPPPPCTVFLTQSLTVYGVSGARFTVPTMSQLGTMGLLAMVLAVGLWSRRRA